MIAIGTRTRQRGPEVAAGATLGEGEGAEVAALGDGALGGGVAVRRNHRGAGVVHAHHHRGRAASAGDALDHGRGRVKTEAEAAVGDGDGQAEEARPAERIDGGGRKVAVVDVAGLGRDVNGERFEGGEDRLESGHGVSKRRVPPRTPSACAAAIGSGNSGPGVGSELAHRGRSPLPEQERPERSTGSGVAKLAGPAIGAHGGGEVSAGPMLAVLT